MMACLPAMWAPPYSQVTLSYCIMHHLSEKKMYYAWPSPNMLMEDIKTTIYSYFFASPPLSVEFDRLQSKLCPCL
jgi:hypothetical protein